MNLFDLFKKVKVRSIAPQTLQAVQKEWQNIDLLLVGNQPSQLKQALISADKTLDNILRDLYEGQTMADRLRNAKTNLGKDLYDVVWQAHLMRNTLVHESGIETPYHVLIQKVKDLRQAVNYLGVRV